MRSLDNQILKLLSNNDVTFFIPPYQRNYEWDEEMCEIFFKDIEKVSNSLNSQHFFGTVIYYAESTILGQPDKYILVDGQQRLTTIILSLCAFRDMLKPLELDSKQKKYLQTIQELLSDFDINIKLYWSVLTNEYFILNYNKINKSQVILIKKYHFFNILFDYFIIIMYLYIVKKKPPS